MSRDDELTPSAHPSGNGVPGVSARVPPGRFTAETRKAAIRATLERVAAVADDVGLVSVARDVRQARLPKLDAEEVSLVVLGEFNHGKSTFLNALIGEPLLPAGILPTTAALVELRRGPEARATVVLASGERRAIALGDIAAWLTIEGQAQRGPTASSDDQIDRIEIEHPAALLAERVTLVDTPGVNDLSEQRADITYGYLPRADAILFLLDAGQILTASERRFLEERILKTTRERLVFVIAKSDLLDGDELAQAERYARDNLAHLVPDPPIFAVSAKRALTGKRAESGLDRLLEHLGGLLGGDRRRWLYDRTLVETARLASFVRQSIAIRQASLELAPEELESRVRRAQQRLGEGTRALVEAAAAITNESAALKARVRQDLALFADAFAAALPAEIEAASPEDVQRYLAPFIEDTFKRFLEAEGAMMAGALEALAEQVVAVANERAGVIARQVAEELGARPGTIDVQVNGFGAEVSVLALGALGSTALLFVSAVMGGVLALVTPFAASIVRAQAMRAAKQDAKQRAPGIVAQLAAALPARLDDVVDAYAGRLDAFVAEAGATLARGIAEVLERALEERKRIVDTATSSAEAQRWTAALAECKRIDEQIADIRQAVWTP